MAEIPEAMVEKAISAASGGQSWRASIFAKRYRHDMRAALTAIGVGEMVDTLTRLAEISTERATSMRLAIVGRDGPNTELIKEVINLAEGIAASANAALTKAGG